ncbi:TIGR03089 family protein [Kineococcus sp. SYSU DK006]|uniref:TIGR03089 family protein n=1 Tax=Kineococcus sp. SYSU DK006 TaxID=3383127 RepID=UPI003D7D9422
MPAGSPRSVPALLQRLVADDPTAPRLTFYGASYERSGERVELSARVLSTWVAKTANLLEEEFEVGPGSVVALDLPAHWRTLVFQLAAWSTGAAVVTGAGGPADVLVSADARVLAAPARAERIAVSLAPLATSFGAEVPDGVLDYARVVTGYGDTHVPLAEPGPEDPALALPGGAGGTGGGTGGGTLTHAGLLAAAAEAGAAWPVGVRLLTDAGPADVVRGPLAAWARTGSLVLTPDLAGLPGGATGRIAAQERTSAVLAVQPPGR